jgi:thioredoxin-related protein
MKIKHIEGIIFTIFLILNYSFCWLVKPKIFPTFSAQTIQGKSIDNRFFEQKKTLVILAHLGCPAAMQLIDDLSYTDTSKFQILIFLENTTSQINAFNSNEKSMWLNLRNNFKLKPIQYHVVAECEKENIEQKNGQIHINPQCRVISKKLRVRSSPYIYHVNQQGEIIQKMEGYWGSKDREKRLDVIFKKLLLE